MVRRIQSQVHHQIGRLIRGGIVAREPAWYAAVMAHPPLPLPPKTPPERTKFDTVTKSPSTKPRLRKAEPLPIHYIEDEIRRQFFRDHPFEAFRPQTLTEGGVIRAAHPIQGSAWIRLRQRGRNPSPEDAIQFAVNLHESHEVPLSHAYARAVAQFRALRAEHQIATSIAGIEADHLGAWFPWSEISLGFSKELRSLNTWGRQSEQDAGAMVARKRWRAITRDHSEPREWSRGEEYVKLWKEGSLPTYSPALTEPLGTSATSVDFNARGPQVRASN